MRFLETVYKCNNKNGAIRTKVKDFIKEPPPQNRIVEILKWSLLPNHYHLLVYEKIKGGVIEFTKRIGNSYTKYFNIKNDRSGYLFQNNAKMVRIENVAHFNYIPFYVELNPLDLYDENWRAGKIKNPAQAIKFLIGYPWSSYADYSGKRNFPELINRNLFYKEFDTNQEKYIKEMGAVINGNKKVSTC